MTWYFKEIDDFKRKTFRSVSLVEFIDELKARFKMRINKIFDKLIAKIFIAKNARENREATSFFQNIILYAQSTNIFDLQTQLIWAWQQLDVDLRTMMIMSTINTSMQDFIEELEIKQDLWKTILTRRSSFSNRSTNKANKRVEKHRFISQQQRQHSSYTFYSSRATYVVSYSQYINYSSRQSMQNLNNYNDQFRQTVSLQQVSLQETTFQRKLIITDSTIDNSIDIENRNFFYQKSKDRQKDNNQRSRDDYKERDDYRSQNHQSNYQQLIYLLSTLIFAYYRHTIHRLDMKRFLTSKYFIMTRLFTRSLTSTTTRSTTSKTTMSLRTHTRRTNTRQKCKVTSTIASTTLTTLEDKMWKTWDTRDLYC